MSFKKGCLLLAFIAGIFNFCYAQTTSSVIRGNIFLQNNIGAEGATAILLNQADSSIVSSALVDNKGEFEFLYVKPGKYLVSAYRLGYTKFYSDPYSVNAGIDLNVAPIYLQPVSTHLKEVAIVAKRLFVEVRPGKTIINPQASITADGKNALEILAQSPGIQVDNNDNVRINGRRSVLILIDGKTTNMTGADLSTLLRNTQGSNIDRMELITGGSAKYDASAGGVINIILKKGKNIGTNGTLNFTAGYGKYYKGVAGITFNNRTKYVNIFGNYNVNSFKTYKYFTNDRNINDNGALSSYNLFYNGVQQSLSHNYRLGADFTLSANHTLGIQVFGFFNNNTFDKNNKLNIANQGHLDSVVNVQSTVDRDLRNINYNINYNGKLDAAGKTLSANLTYSPYNRESDEYINNMFTTVAGSVYRDAVLLQNLSPSHRRNWTGMLDYVNPLTKTSKLEAGFKFSHTKSTNNLVFGPQVGGVYTIDPDFSNNFVYNEDVHAAYLNYNGMLGKVELTAGLRGEYTHSEGASMGTGSAIAEVTTFNYFKLFPNLLLHYAYNDKNDYTLSFTRGLLRPDYESLNPFLYYVDPYDFQAGNPYLKPEFTNALTLTYTYNQSLSVALNAGYTTDANFTYYTQNNATKVNLTTMRNIGTIKNIGVDVNEPFTVTKWWSGNININAAYIHYKTYPVNGYLDKGTGDVIFTTTQSFAISKSLALEILGRYETANQYGIRSFSPNYYVNAGLSTPLFGKRGRLSLNVTDVFNSNRDKAYTNFNGLDLRIYSKPETRIARLNFSYRFGKTTVKSATTHVTGNEDEQTRMRKTSN